MHKSALVFTALLLAACGSTRETDGDEVPVQMYVTSARPAPEVSGVRRVDVTVSEVWIHLVGKAEMGRASEGASLDPESGQCLSEVGEIVPCAPAGESTDTLSTGWHRICDQPSSFDLLSLAAGQPVPICASVRVTSGKLTQIRLVLSRAVIVWEDGTESELRIPSSGKTGLKIVGLARQLDPGTGKVTVDFDGLSSIHWAGGDYVMRPTLRLAGD